jgi:hypothetical protein
LSRAAVEHIQSFINEHPDYRRYHAYTLIPDELFFHSILAGSDFAQKHEIVNDNLRFMRWTQNDDHPDTLTLTDIPAILASQKLFARKFDITVDPEALERLQVHSAV